MNYDKRIAQCGAAIRALAAEKKRLIAEQEAAKEIQWEHGDIAKTTGGALRLFIRGSNGLMIFEMNKGNLFFLGNRTAEEWAEHYDYVRTGNIFEG